MESLPALDGGPDVSSVITLCLCRKSNICVGDGLSGAECSAGEEEILSTPEGLGGAQRRTPSSFPTQWESAKERATAGEEDEKRSELESKAAAEVP